MSGIIFGTIGIIVGSLIIIYTDWIVRNFGRNAWAERHMGMSGGSRLFYKLIGLVIIIISLMGATGLLGGVILNLFSFMFTSGI